MGHLPSSLFPFKKFCHDTNQWKWERGGSEFFTIWYLSFRSPWQENEIGLLEGEGGAK